MISYWWCLVHTLNHLYNCSATVDMVSFKKADTCSVSDSYNLINLFLPYFHLNSRNVLLAQKSNPRLWGGATFPLATDGKETWHINKKIPRQWVEEHICRLFPTVTQKPLSPPPWPSSSLSFGLVSWGSRLVLPHPWVSAKATAGFF